ncbi:uncharacterized protein EI90DRAFT_3062124 [Cantharellus anzutake]|uniref:uncharacterized protein n=1 Tax=Cantharellus anzutake TaxID=1750568 RepID=UPI001903B8AE|nr:uncharacterized protein EI90DRAFT_3062124 [Cantharellus anzutake]KAF8329824.1 hypothetical protein EI90DRAFT_3062124 [Cantharellus anzutake]
MMPFIASGVRSLNLLWPVLQLHCLVKRGHWLLCPSIWYVDAPRSNNLKKFNTASAIDLCHEFN